MLTTYDVFPAYVSEAPNPYPVIVAPFVVVFDANPTVTFPTYHPLLPAFPSVTFNVHDGFDTGVFVFSRFTVRSHAAALPALSIT